MPQHIVIRQCVVNSDSYWNAMSDVFLGISGIMESFMSFIEPIYYNMDIELVNLYVLLVS